MPDRVKFIVEWHRYKHFVFPQAASPPIGIEIRSRIHTDVVFGLGLLQVVFGAGHDGSLSSFHHQASLMHRLHAQHAI
jgi:hypothetical protein